jgi:hypothetical protein
MLRRSGQPDNIPDIDLIRVYNFGKRIEPDEKTTAEIKRHIIKLNSTDSRTREKASAALVEPRLAIFLPAVRNKRDETPEQSTRLDCIFATYRIRSIDASIVHQFEKAMGYKISESGVYVEIPSPPPPDMGG